MSREIDFWDPTDPDAITRVNGIPEAILNGTGPTFMANPWDTVLVDGKPLPGFCTVTFDAEMGIDVSKSSGTDGGVPYLKGRPPVQVEIRVTMWTQAQWKEFVAVVPLLMRRANKRDPKSTPRKFVPDAAIKETAKGLKLSLDQAVVFATAISVSHPDLALHGVSAIVVGSVSSADDGPIKGSRTVRIRGVQYLIPKNPAPGKVRPPKDRKEDPREPPAKNEGGQPPHKTDCGPTGPKPDRTPGSH